MKKLFLLRTKKFIFGTIVLLSFLHTIPALSQLSAQQQNNLVAFSRLYGYVRYFHPSDEAAALDWPLFARLGAQQMLVVKNNDELVNSLQQLFRPIAPSAIIYPSSAATDFSINSITPADKSGYTIIAWQHQGYGVETQPASVYQSIRTNRPGKSKQASASFAPVSQAIPADSFAGKAFRFKGWMKVAAGKNGSGHFWFRVDKEKNKQGFFYNMGDRPATENNWKEYSFNGTIDKDAKNIVFGAFLSGKGSMWVDDIELSFQQADGSWKKYTPDNSGFEKQNKNKVPSGWLFNDNLDGYTFSTDTKEVKTGTGALLVASVEPEKNESIAKLLFDQYPKPGETIRKELVPGISCIVPLALYGNRDHTYPQADLPGVDALDQQLRSIDKGVPSGDSLSVRLGDVIISWNIFRHFFPYWEDAADTPENILMAALRSAGTDRNRLAFRKTLLDMTSKFNDGHIWVNMSGDTTLGHYPALVVAPAENKIIIEKVLDSALMKQLSPGDEIVSIDQKNGKQVIDSISALISGSAQWKLSRTFNQLLEGSANSSVNLTVIHQGASTNISLPRSMNASGYYGQLQRKTKAGWIKPGIFYIDLDRNPMDSIKKWMPDLENAKAIICDLRGYPNNNHELINHLLTKREDSKWMLVPQIIYPDYQQVSFLEEGWHMSPLQPHLSAKIFFLTDGRAISYAESYMGYIKDYKLATIIGGPTAGTNGNINPISLPGYYSISWTGMMVKNHDGSKHHLKGITPDVPVQRTIAGIRDGRDEFLEKAIALSEQQ